MKLNYTPNHRFKEPRTHEEYVAELIKRGIPYVPVESYTRDRVHIKHKCKLGHEWIAQPNMILRGTGCPHCCKYSFDKSKETKLYLVSFKFRDKTFYKLGVTTNKRIMDRFKHEWYQLQMKVVWTIPFALGSEALKLEKQLHVENKENKYNTGALKSGNTETYEVPIEKPVV